MIAARREFLGSIAGATAAVFMPRAALADERSPALVISRWYGVILELVRHTATFSPPVASRAFAYIGIAVHETFAGGTDSSLAGRVNALPPVPERAAGMEHDDAAMLHACLHAMVSALFANTGPTGQRVITRFGEKTLAMVVAGLPADVAGRSLARGTAVAGHILEWSRSDGGATIENLGFPKSHEFGNSPASWTPTSQVSLQQVPLLPNWGGNRTFAMAHGGSCPLPPPPPYSEDPASQFWKEAEEVRRTVANLTAEQRAIARFWSDDAMASPTPPGHWIAIALAALAREGADAGRYGETLALLGIALADAFIGCWHAKYEFDLLRPVTYIRRVIDASFEPPLITPPFPEYPSGHSTQSGAAAAVLTALFGEPYAFVDRTHERDGLAARSFASFRHAAEEAGISRLYGGIHFRAAIERGLDQGRCIGAHALALRKGR
jgi:hypothetical protein